jgi:uncharacterized membrane protein
MNEESEDELLGPLDPAESWVAHLYRGEIHRMKHWRERLDRTTNWAVITMVGILTWSFSNPQHPHYILLGGIATTLIFLNIEARRYRGHEIWHNRVRTIQRNVMAPVIDPRIEQEDYSWREKLAKSYRDPGIHLPYEQAIAHRLQRIYLPIFSILIIVWILRVTAFDPAGWPSSAQIGYISGEVITGVVAIFYIILLCVTYRPRRNWDTEGELKEELN